MFTGKKIQAFFGAAIIVGGFVTGPVLAQQSEIPSNQADWEGQWAGISVGWKWLETDFNGSPNDWAVPPATGNGGETRFTTGTPASKSGSLSPDGINVDGVYGYNWRNGLFIYGIEGIAGWVDAQESEVSTQTSVADYSGTGGAETDLANRSETCRTAKDMDIEGALRGRVGYLVSPNTLIFVTAGLSTARVNHDVNCLSTTNFFDGNGAFEGAHTTSATGSDTDWEFGYTLGAGGEMQLKNGMWRVRFDYNYVDLGSNSQTLSISRSATTLTNTGPNSSRYEWDEYYHKIRFSLIRKFGSPEPAPFK